MESKAPVRGIFNIKKILFVDKLYILLIPLFLVLVVVGLAIYYYAPLRKDKKLMRAGSTTINIEQLAVLDGSENILRGDFNTMAGVVKNKRDNILDIERKGQVVGIPVETSTPVYLQEILPEQGIYLEDTAIGSQGAPVVLKKDKVINVNDIQLGEQVFIVFLKADENNLKVKSIYSFRYSE